MNAVQDPFILFTEWFKEAQASEINDPNAMALATVDAEGFPNVRMVLLKGFDAGGFVFYTNLKSTKGRELAQMPKAALCFHWKSLRKQVRVRGVVEPVPDQEADDYYRNRPRQSQIGAWASQQSRPLEGRFALEKAVAATAAQYPVGSIPRPPYWSGFRVAPKHIEFWSDGAFRLHDRLVFHRAGNGWETERLYP